MSDQRSEFEEMCDKWDAAVNSGLFKDSQRPTTPAPDYGSANYGMSPQVADLAANSEKYSDADYWNTLFRLSRNQSERPSAEEVLSEIRSRRPSAEEALNEIRTTYPPNPIPSYSFGKDQDPVVTPNWIDGTDLNKLNKMKLELHALGDKLAVLGRKIDGKPLVQGKEPGDEILRKIKSLSEQIDDLSDSLAPGKLRDLQS